MEKGSNLRTSAEIHCLTILFSFSHEPTSEIQPVVTKKKPVRKQEKHSSGGSLVLINKIHSKNGKNPGYIRASV